MTPHWLDAPLAITATAFRRIQQAVQRWPVTPAGDAHADVVAAAPVRPATRGAVRVIPVRGVLVPRATSWSWLFDELGIDRLQLALREALADVAVGAIVLDIDSPGGSVYGIEELAAEIRAAKAQKPIVAIANPLAASAAYYLASAASDVVVTPSGEVGSVGVYSLHLDWSRALDQEGVTPTFIFAGEHKVEGNPYEPLTDDARQALQASVDRYYGLFVQAVAKGRGVSVSAVRADFGKGRVIGPKEALAAKMVDAIGTLDDAVARAAALTRSAARATSAQSVADTVRTLLAAGVDPASPQFSGLSEPDGRPIVVTPEGAVIGLDAQAVSEEVVVPSDERTVLTADQVREMDAKSLGESRPVDDATSAPTTDDADYLAIERLRAEVAAL